MTEHRPADHAEYGPDDFEDQSDPPELRFSGKVLFFIAGMIAMSAVLYAWDNLL